MSCVAAGEEGKGNKKINIERPTSNAEWKGIRWLLTVNLEPMNLEPGLPRRSRRQRREQSDGRRPNDK